MLSIQLAEAGLLDINGSLIAEIIAFLVMLAILARFVYPPVMRAADARQKQIEKQLQDAEKARKEAESRLQEAERRSQEARDQAQEIINGANRSGDQLRQELKQKGEEEAKRLTESAKREIETAKQQAIDAVRGEVADLVVLATERVVGETLDGQRHRALIDRAIEEAASGERQR